MRTLLVLAAAAVLTSLAPRQARALDPNEADPRTIMRAVEGRDLGDRMRATFTMSIRDPTGHERTRSGSVREMADEGARKLLLMFDAPADIRNTGLLVVDYDDAAKPDDQWLYLPFLSQTSRITGASRAGALVGSDLSFADLTRRDPDRYDYTLVSPSAVVDGEDCWLVEAVPKSDEERAATGYTRMQLWVSKAKLLPLQVAATLAKGDAVKRIKLFDVRQIDGVWTAQRVVARTEKGGETRSTTVMTWAGITYRSPDVTRDVFTTLRLERGL